MKILFVQPPVVLNLSGNSDAEMIRLFEWVHMKMDVNYLMTMLMQTGKVLRPIFWEHLMRTLREIERHYRPSFRQLPLIGVMFHYTFSFLYRTIAIFRYLILKLHDTTS